LRQNRTKNQESRTKFRQEPLRDALGSDSLVSGSRKTGTVFLVGAGPGDPGLLTLRGRAALRQADVVLYDALVHSVVVDFAVNAEKIFVGKLPYRTSAALPQPAKGKHHSSWTEGTEEKQNCKAPDQDEINRSMVELARQGKKVVRLKGGDPFVFGRGGEEAEYLKKNGISFEIIPGVSAGNAVPAFAGIPVTDRRFASAVVYVTAHENPEKNQVTVDWKKLAQLNATLVCFMGVKSLPRVTKELMSGGKSAATPACVIEWGTLARQRVVEGTLQNISARALAEKIESPALTVIGEVVSLRKTLDWFGKQPLAGKRILITRATADAGPFRAMLESEGAVVCEAPMIKIEPPRSWDLFDRDVIAHIERFGWILFTSVHAVEAFFARLRELARDSRALGKCRVAAVGDKTAEALRARGIEPDLMPKAFHSRELLRELQEKYFVRGQKFLWPRADIAPMDIKTELEKAGATVTDAILYHTVPDSEGKKRVAELLAEEPIDYVVFTSGSGVKNFFQGLGACGEEKNILQKVKGCVVSIGPQTSQVLNDAKIPILAEAKTHNLDGLLQTLKDLASGTKNQEPRNKNQKQQSEIEKPGIKEGDRPAPQTIKEKLAQRPSMAKPVYRSSATRTQSFAPRPRRIK